MTRTEIKLLVRAANRYYRAIYMHQHSQITSAQLGIDRTWAGLFTRSAGTSKSRLLNCCCTTNVLAQLLKPSLASHRGIIDDLLQLQAAYGDDFQLSVLDPDLYDSPPDTTEYVVRVTIRNIDLVEPDSGDSYHFPWFTIHINLTRFTDIWCEGDKSHASYAGHLHPNVSADYPALLCLGNGQSLYASAWQAGEIAAAVEIALATLRSYGRENAYHRLLTWDGDEGVLCTECEEPVADDDLYHCTRCDSAMHSNCAIYIDGSDTVYCSYCVHTLGGIAFCSQCRTRNLQCDLVQVENSTVCADCLEEFPVCTVCNGPIHIDSAEESKCPYCTCLIHADCGHGAVDSQGVWRTLCPDCFKCFAVLDENGNWIDISDQCCDHCGEQGTTDGPLVPCEECDALSHEVCLTKVLKADGSGYLLLCTNCSAGALASARTETT